ncbi:hypothetical protein AVEN_65031-1 [Araneus ventricosus]|uniref:DUF4817 domain-containing protein n=1 Tax=Araneus ventricosus TaxID=182803 RepID=A0A4Y2SHU8_ARAVE|nr:hypothetical protein AVEN_150668-1 [Araneus ventricosus]GBN59477.1 hypothetical protein AVEN_186717-1 [Araneus ventricosus]GBN86785.1 hypothetical protein AVEN_99454-1 [Araneus ventricosus]GBN86786.1 hypothetical protein AVEN_65031-1 [Araneus ventricosus]
MSKYRVSERMSIVKAYYSSNNSPIATQRKFATEYELKTTGPSVITIKNVIKKFERTGSVDVSTLKRFLQNFAFVYATSSPLMQAYRTCRKLNPNICSYF